MFFKIKDPEGDMGYVNLSLVEFVRKDLNGDVTLFFIAGKPIKLSNSNAKDLSKYIDSISMNVVN